MKATCRPRLTCPRTWLQRKTKSMPRSATPTPAPAEIVTVESMLRPDPLQNMLLAALPPAEWARWQPQLELVDLPLGKVLHESSVPMHYVYFPTSAIISLLYVLEN